ncbi:MAG TPA: SDR family oxidoreductase [Candidatus Sulfotelmatobacter sp.]|nr:SDR family oxidoreductase [Candidatus Sulfotelmatobacter sp.]
MSLIDRVAIVAGASGGIGAATVRAFLAAGMRVVLAAPDDELLAALAAELVPYGDWVRVVPTDITRREQIDALVDATLAAFGRIDVLANIAGVSAGPSLAEATDAEIERVLAVNLLGAARTMHAVLPAMRAQRSGAIINVGSIAGEIAIMGIYSGSKFGLRGLTDSVRRELRSEGIGVTLIEPGFVDTPMNVGMTKLPSPDIVARAIVRAVRRPRRRVIVPRRYLLALLFFKLSPHFTDLVFGDARVQRRLNQPIREARAAAQAAAER